MYLNCIIGNKYNFPFSFSLYKNFIKYIYFAHNIEIEKSNKKRRVLNITGHTRW